ncbi:MAG: hypothetical protein HZB55_02180 [Deltaproteobacteria bacterium]|nr:hypothetical protein [Deltaproteobacteria bacterium]
MAVDISRSGDDITLSFGARRNEERADFRLFGNKHDYYRMAMGVHLNETFRLLTQADPNIQPIDVVKNDQDLILRLGYAWSKASEPAQAPPAAAPLPSPSPAATPAQAPAQEAEPQLRRVSRRERVVGQPPPEEEPERNPKYFVPARPLLGESTEAEVPTPQPSAPPPAPPPARPSAGPATPATPPEAVAEVSVPTPAEPPPGDTGLRVRVTPTPEAPPEPSPAEKAETAFREATEEGTLAAWEEFLVAFPSVAQAKEARARVETLRAEAEYEKAKSADEAQAYRGFLQRFPSSVRVPEVEARLRALELQQEQARAESRARTEVDRRRREAYDETRRLDNTTAYRVFLAAYPDAPEAPEIRQYLKGSEADDAAFAEATGSTAGLEAYLATRPKGRHADDARKRLTALRNAGSEVAFQEAQARGSSEALEVFLKAWPKSPKVPEARAALDAFRKGKTEPGAGAPLPESTVVAPYVGSPPVINGRANDSAWQSAPGTEIPVAGGPRSIVVKAVHDGRTLYLLAQWNDASRDDQYRPWIWDAAKKTYRQGSQVDDALAVALFRGKPPSDSCMLQGQNQEADLWIWRAFWSELSGLAEDETYRISRERIPKSNPYASRGGAGQVWIREDPDSGSPGWSFFIPVDYQGAVIPSYRRAEASGSRGDVKAAGLWEGGTWTVEFARALDTRHADDLALKERNTYALSFAVYDKAEKGRHAASGLVRLELRGR